MSTVSELYLFGVTGIGEVRPGDDLATLLVEALTGAGRPLLTGDVLVVSSKVVSKAEGRVVAADTRDAQIVAETVRAVASRRTPRGRAWIVEAAAGPVMAAAGVDASNVAPGTVLLLPKDPDASARALRARVQALTGTTVGVIVSDTAGRAWRAGQVDFALGAAGVAVTDDLRGAVDTYGQPLEVTVRALADELAAATDLVKGKLTGLPAAVVRGAGALVTEADGPGAAVLLRPGREDWFRYGHVEAITAGLGLDPAVVEPPTVPTGPVAARFARVLALAGSAPTPWLPASDAAGPAAEQVVAEQVVPEQVVPEQVVAEQQDNTGTLSLVGPDGTARAATTPADWATLGATAQRVTAAAWAEDLAVEITLVEGPPAALQIVAIDR